MIKRKKVLLLSIAIIAYSIGIITSIDSMEQSNNKIRYICKVDNVKLVIEEDIIDNIEQKKIRNLDYSYELNNLDEILPLAVKKYNLSVEDFEKQELEGLFYSYETIRNNVIFYFELDKIQSNPMYTTYSLYKIL